jgi:DNA-binding Lrp family transcriptional regulator
MSDIQKAKGIWIPVELINLDISWTKRILLAEINQLEMLDHGCIASNAHFADKLKITKQAISKALNELAKDGFIKIDNAQSKRNFGRIITINFSKSAINFSKSGVHQSGESKDNKTNKDNKPFNFSLNKLTTFDNLSDKYHQNLKAAITDIISKEGFTGLDYETFKSICEAKGYKYKNFLSAFRSWHNKNKKAMTGPDDLLDLRKKAIAKLEAETGKREFTLDGMAYLVTIMSTTTAPKYDKPLSPDLEIACLKRIVNAS